MPSLFISFNVMSIAILGINHKTASVAVREKVAFSPEKLEKALYDLNQHPLIHGCVILSTCNRSELYLSFERISDLMHIQCAVKTWMYQFHEMQAADMENCLYWHVNQSAVTHLMRVSCGMDSQILGESQILGQVKKAYIFAQTAATTSVELAKLFQRVFYVAKRVRSTTNIGSNTASIAYAACLWARQLFEKADEVTVLLIGAGETIELISHYLKHHKFKHSIIANRTREKALKLAQHLDAEIIALPEISSRLKDADIIISSTASPLPIIGKGLVERSLQIRQNRPMLFIDLAIPRDIEREVGELSNISLATLDDLQDMVNANLAKREVAAKEAEYIIQEESLQFMEWIRSRIAIDFIKTYRTRAHNIKQNLEIKALNAIHQGADIQEVIKQLSHRLTNQLIHAPTRSLLHAATNNDDYLKILSESFGLDK